MNRDLAKDKALISDLHNEDSISVHDFADNLLEISSYWIAQYEEAVKLRSLAQQAYGEVEDMLRAAQAHISSLESRLHETTGNDIWSCREHDTALETVFKEIEEGKA